MQRMLCTPYVLLHLKKSSWTIRVCMSSLLPLRKDLELVCKNILLASKRAIGVWEERRKKGKKEGSELFFSVFFPHKWLPIVKAYKAGTATYFATPPVNLIYAFHASLSLITGKEKRTYAIPPRTLQTLSPS